MGITGRRVGLDAAPGFDRAVEHRARFRWAAPGRRRFHRELAHGSGVAELLGVDVDGHGLVIAHQIDRRVVAEQLDHALAWRMACLRTPRGVATGGEVRQEQQARLVGGVVELQVG